MTSAVSLADERLGKGTVCQLGTVILHVTSVLCNSCHGTGRGLILSTKWTSWDKLHRSFTEEDHDRYTNHPWLSDEP